MKMRLLLYSLLCGIVCLNGTVRAWKFWEWSPQPSVDYAQLQSDVQDELDRVVFNKLENITEEMMRARSKLSKGIVNHVRDSKCYSQEEARQEAIAAVKPAVKHFIIDMGAQKIGQEIISYYNGRPPYNPQQFEQNVKQELANQVDDAFRKNKDVTPFLKLAVLKEIIKQLDKNYGVQAGGVPTSSQSTGLYPNLDKLSSQNYTAQLPAGVDQPAGAPRDNIHELYPQFNEKTAEGLERNEKFFGPFFQKVK